MVLTRVCPTTTGKEVPENGGSTELESLYDFGYCYSPDLRHGTLSLPSIVRGVCPMYNVLIWSWLALAA
jgi:hypothetical protein